jgi:hypothetical protein
MKRIRKARQRVAEFYAKSAAAQPGEVWTTIYAGPDFQGNYFESYTAGTVRVLGDECPVVEYRGRKTLGESDLDPEAWWPWSWIGRLFLIREAMGGRNRTLEPGDTAPDMTGSTGTGDLLAALPVGAWVTVEYRGEHPVYAGLRNVVVGFTYDHDGYVRGVPGRDVGGDWVPFAQVTAVICHSHAEVAS